MIIRLSTKLGKKIHVSPRVVLPYDANPYADWSARLFTADRAHYILITNTRSLYSMVMAGKGITDGSLFLSRMIGTMRDFMTADGFAFLFERLMAPAAARVSFSKAHDRAVTGSMNDFVFQAAYHLAAQASPFETAVLLNRTPMTYLNYGNPKEAFQKMKLDAMWSDAG